MSDPTSSVILAALRRINADQVSALLVYAAAFGVGAGVTYLLWTRQPPRRSSQVSTGGGQQ